MKKDYDQIKDYYGEQMSKLCRALFPGILEKEGLLFSILSSTFAFNRYLCHDIIIHDKVDDFKNYILGLCFSSLDYVKTDKSVKELFEEVGYDFYECHTDKDILEFKKYYSDKEILCTFHEDRLSTHHVFWAVKKNVDDIVRSDVPCREDDYGVSVISLQFCKGKCNTLSIKNRYNHSVDNADATFSNDLEKINSGLTYAFSSEYGFHFEPEPMSLFYLPGYTKACDGRYYKFNLEINGIYYCPNNVVIDHGKIIQFDFSKYLVIDYYIVDLMKKSIRLYDNNLSDGFLSFCHNVERIKILRNEDGKRLFVNKSDNNSFIVDVDKLGQIVGFESDSLVCMEGNFFKMNKALNKFVCPNLKIISSSCLCYNNSLKIFDCENVIFIGDNFLHCNVILNNINLVSVREIGNSVLSFNKNLINIKLSNAVSIGNDFLCENEDLVSICAPRLRECGDNFLYSNNRVRKIHLPKLTDVGDNFLYSNVKSLRECYVPMLKNVGHNFLRCNTSVRKVCFDNIEVVGKYFIASNKLLKDYEIPKLSFFDIGFLECNKFWQLKKEDIRRKANLKKSLVRYRRY